MKKLAKILLGLMVLTSLPAFSAEKHTYKIKELMCSACENKVKKALKDVKGVEIVSVVAKTKTAIVKISKDSEMTSEKLKNHIHKETGFTPEEVKNAQPKG